METLAHLIGVLIVIKVLFICLYLVVIFESRSKKWMSLNKELDTLRSALDTSVNQSLMLARRIAIYETPMQKPAAKEGESNAS